MPTEQDTRTLACLGGEPAFTRPIPVGQLYFPSWERYEQAMAGIFDRGWYTNHGPLAREFEERLARFFGVKHAIAVTNATVGLIMALRCLGLEGKVVVPGFTFVASAQSISWAGLEVKFCDVDRATHQVTVATLAEALDPDVSAILAVNLWGGTCRPAAIAAFARERGLKLVFDSAHGAGVTCDGVPLGGFGDAEVFSFHATKVLSATEGGCICTDNDELAARLRNMRSSYGSGPPVAVPLTSNGRFSEAQAAIGLMSLEDLPANRAHNERIFDVYRQGLSGITGLNMVEPADTDRSNYQYAVAEVDHDACGLSRDGVLRALHAEQVIARRYFHPGVHRTMPYRAEPDRWQLPVTDQLCGGLLQLPIGALLSEDDAIQIIELLARIDANGAAVAGAVGGGS
ncbi:MAG: aminotransferase class I/II-fold pyridoxal phosphate-dependent enzyme [Solirubrobacteraceae bacterium]